MHSTEPFATRLFAGLFCALLVGALATRQSVADDVQWLAEVQQPPQNPVKNSLRPLRIDAEGKPIRDAAAWQVERDKLVKAWLEFLGPMPERNVSNQFEVLKEETVAGGIRRQLIRYQAEEGEIVDAHLLWPAENSPGSTNGKRAGLVALHATKKTGNDPIAGIGDETNDVQGLDLCQRGFVVICPRNYLWDTPDHHLDVKDTVDRFHARHPRTLGMHKMLFDAQRATDILANIPEVDPDRLGAVGHSLGSKEVIYLMAFDERIKAGVASEGGVGLTFTNWGDPWYLGSGINEPGFPRDHHELLALCAPRAILILAGEEGPGAADGDRTWPYVEEALGVYRFYKTPPKIGLFNHHQGHSIPHDAHERMCQWLQCYTQASAAQ